MNIIDRVYGLNGETLTTVTGLMFRGIPEGADRGATMAGAVVGALRGKIIDGTRRTMETGVGVGNRVLGLLGATEFTHLPEAQPPHVSLEALMAQLPEGVRDQVPTLQAFLNFWVVLARTHDRADSTQPFKATTTYLADAARKLSLLGVPEHLIGGTREEPGAFNRAMEALSPTDRAEVDDDEPTALDGKSHITLVPPAE